MKKLFPLSIAKNLQNRKNNSYQSCHPCFQPFNLWLLKKGKGCHLMFKVLVIEVETFFIGAKCSWMHRKSENISLVWTAENRVLPRMQISRSDLLHLIISNIAYIKWTLFQSQNAHVTCHGGIVKRTLLRERAVLIHVYLECFVAKVTVVVWNVQRENMVLVIIPSAFCC